MREVGLHGAILTPGGVHVQDYSRRAVGNFRHLGSYTVGSQDITGVFNSSSTTLVAGLMERHTYDARLGDNPPPTFPETNEYQIISYQVDIPPLP